MDVRPTSLLSRGRDSKGTVARGSWALASSSGGCLAGQRSVHACHHIASGALARNVRATDPPFVCSARGWSLHDTPIRSFGDGGGAVLCCTANLSGTYPSATSCKSTAHPRAHQDE